MVWWLVGLAALQFAPDTSSRLPPRSEVFRPDPAVDPAQPQWVRRPTGWELQRFYPSEAQRIGQAGRTIMRCSVALDGRLSGCVLLAESPVSRGFGQAAIGLARYFQMTPLPAGAVAEPRSVMIPINWRIEGTRTRVDWSSGMSLVPNFRAAPDRAAVAAVRPAGATGEAMISCLVRSTGRLYDCRALGAEEETSPLAVAALSLAPAFELQPGTVSGERLARIRVSVPIRFADEPAYLTRPRWARTPTGQEMQAALQPLAAAREDRTAEGRVDCRVGPGGVLSECRVISETAPGAGAAAAALAERFAVRLWTDEGSPTVGARVRLPLRYVDD